LKTLLHLQTCLIDIKNEDIVIEEINEDILIEEIKNKKSENDEIFEELTESLKTSKVKKLYLKKSRLKKLKILEPNLKKLENLLKKLKMKILWLKKSRTRNVKRMYFWRSNRVFWIHQEWRTSVWRNQDRRIWKFWKWILEGWFDICSVYFTDVTALCSLYWDSDFISFRCWFAWVPVLESLAKDLHSNIFYERSYFDTVEQFFSKSSLQNKPKWMRKNSTGLWLFLCIWMIMTDSVMLSKAVFNGKYPTHPLSQLKMQLMRTYQNIVHLDSMVKLGPTSFVYFCILKVSRMFCINIGQPYLEL